MPDYKVRFKRIHIYEIVVAGNNTEDAMALASETLFLTNAQPLVYGTIDIYDKDGNDIDWEAEEARMAKQQEDENA